MALGSVSGFYPGGRPSGLPDNIVEQLVNAKRMQEVDPLQRDLQNVKYQKDVYSKLDSKLTNMAEAADKLNDSQVFQARSASTSDSAVVEASADNTASEGTYSVDVTNPAQAHNHVVGTDESGTLKGIEDPNESSLINADMELSFYHQGSQYTYATDSETTLSSLADKISEDSNGVSASVSNKNTTENPEYVLSLKSESTGAGDNRITTDGDPANTGVKITDNGGGTLFDSASAMQNETVTGKNADFSVDGVSYERQSNEVSDVIDGVTLNIKESGTADVSVSQDVQSAADQVQSFVDTFNKTNNFIEKQSDYNKEEDRAGPLNGSSIARSAESKMTRVLMEPIKGTADEPYQYLSQVGFEFQRDGSLDFDADEFKSAMRDNPQAVEKLFVGDEGAAGKMENTLKNAFTDNIDGAVQTKLDSISNRIDRINDEIDREEQSLQEYRERTVERFSEMEKAIMKYQGIESQLGNWMDLGKDDEK
jgi:flagellar hook-associated protein 2